MWPSRVCVRTPRASGSRSSDLPQVLGGDTRQVFDHGGLVSALEKVGDVAHDVAVGEIVRQRQRGLLEHGGAQRGDARYVTLAPQGSDSDVRDVTAVAARGGRSVVAGVDEGLRRHRADGPRRGHRFDLHPHPGGAGHRRGRVSTRRGGRGSAPRVMHGREERDRSHRARCVCRSKTRGMDPCARRCEEAPTTR